MKARRIDELFARLDRAVRWTGVPALVADEIAGRPMHQSMRQLRWMPMLLIVAAIALFVLSLLRPSVLDVSMGSVVIGLTVIIQQLGPLKKMGFDDDEREAEVRKGAWLFCFTVLACLNCLGQPFLAIVPQLKGWSLEHTVIAAGAAFNLNFCLLGTLPTLHASWSLRQLPPE